MRQLEKSMEVQSIPVVFEMDLDKIIRR